MDGNAALAVLLAVLPIVLERRMKTASAIWHHLLTAFCFLLALLIVLDMQWVQGLLASMPKHVAAGLVALIFAVVGWGTYWLTGERAPAAPVVTESPAPSPVQDSAPAKPVIAVTSEGPYLVVRNTGAPAVFRAHLLVAHTQEFPTVTEGSRFEGIWQTTMTDRSEIATGDADRVMLGAVAGDRDTAVTPLHYYDAVAKKMGVREARQMPGRGAPALWVDITIVSVPALAGGPQTFECTVTQGRVDFLQPKP